MFEKVLVANRGELAVRVIRACRDLGIRTVTIYSDADAESLPVIMADEAVCVGPASAGASYLNVPHIIAAALNTGADAIHPGAGFLAENAYFADVCAEYQITFVGPAADSIRAMGDKTRARVAARESGLPIVPGSDGPVQDVIAAKKVAREIGYPVMLKAARGGGGKGIRPVADADELVSLFPLAQAEARSSFGDAGLYIEKRVAAARHVEVQILGDGSQVVHLGHRECSIQRRYQKLVEEAPAPNLPGRVGDRIAQAAVRLMRDLKYRSAGTVEFLLDEGGQFHFMEVNTRIQVEHPITEAISGIDIVKAQIEIAAGLPLPMRQRDVNLAGHALEFRVIAEDPDRDFRPSAGKIERALLPGGVGVRVDTHIFAGYEVPPFYDSLLAKIVVWGETREQAVTRARRALAETVIDGPATNLQFHRDTVDDPAFAAAAYNAGYVYSAREPVADGST